MAYKNGNVEESSVDRRLMKSNPDVGPKGEQSGHMGMSRDDYGMESKYRGNKYEENFQKINASDAKKLKRSMKSKI